MYSHFCKLDPFIDMNNICCITMKSCKLQKELVNLDQKCVMRLTPARQAIQFFYNNLMILQFF